MNARKSDRTHERTQKQRLAIAAGMTLSDGSPIVVGGLKCPSTAKIKAAIGFEANRMTRAQKYEAFGEYGAAGNLGTVDANGVASARPYFAASHEGSGEVESILGEWSGMSDCDGEMSLRDLLQIS